jgi:hypothetical protein
VSAQKSFWVFVEWAGSRWGAVYFAEMYSLVSAARYSQNARWSDLNICPARLKTCIVFV